MSSDHTALARSSLSLASAKTSDSVAFPVATGLLCCIVQIILLALSFCKLHVQVGYCFLLFNKLRFYGRGSASPIGDLGLISPRLSS